MEKEEKEKKKKGEEIRGNVGIVMSLTQAVFYTGRKIPCVGILKTSCPKYETPLRRVFPFGNWSVVSF